MLLLVIQNCVFGYFYTFTICFTYCINVIYNCVMGYFSTFTICYTYSLYTLRIIIDKLIESNIMIYNLSFLGLLYFSLSIYKIKIKNINYLYDK